ncbi:D-alanyl-D-alanine carboxypeptidase [Streptomyces sp. NBC_00287]|uniref:D-alanyl-D-alanine carboxypeptidase n=1 Tax=Streptomyces sp. NBC_00287 TaxID=2975702 RepID=UPI003FA6ED96
MDTATRILSASDLAEARKPATPEPEAEAEEPDSGDARLRAAVAAWVSKGDEKPTEPEEPTEEAEEEAPEEEAPEEEPQNEAASEDEPEDETEPEPEDETETEPEAEAEDEDSEPETEAAADDEPEAAADEDEAETEDAPEAADDEEAPQGPPAPDDEASTGGAGGNDTAEGEAEDAPHDEPAAADAEDAKRDAPAAADAAEDAKRDAPAAKAVDHPTTAIRAPRPPAVDQPTSKFVALKPDVTTAIPHVGPERTTQQPLPPKPPLDLLAELTNTPPPPDTPVRNLVRRVKIWTPLVLLLVVVFAIVQAVRPLPTPTLDLTAESTYTFDGSEVDIPWPAEGQAALDVQGIGSFGSSGDQKPVPIASVAKVMTAYVILRDHSLKSGEEGPKIEIDQAAEEQATAEGESTVKVTAGDSITQREALESILIASANNVARLLARWDAGSEKAFVEKMNAAAEDLGMTNTTYTDPSGLNNTTVSTAVDQMKLAKAAMEDPAFREVSAMMSYDDYKGENHGNWNQLVGKNNVVGIKTGTTTSALGNLMFAAKQEVGGETRTIVGAVLRQPDVGGGILAAALDSGDQLIRAAQGALESATLLKKGDVVGYVDDGLGGRTPVVATKDVKAVGWAGLKVELDFKADAVPHEARAGTKVGTLTVGDGGTAGAVKVPVALQSDLVEPGFTDKLIRVS